MSWVVELHGDKQRRCQRVVTKLEGAEGDENASLCTEYEWPRSYREINQHPGLLGNCMIRVFLRPAAFSDQSDS